jgi:hypothetical protein
VPTSDDFYHVQSMVKALAGPTVIGAGLGVAGKQVKDVIVAKINAGSSERIAQIQADAARAGAKVRVEIARIQRGEPTGGRRPPARAVTPHARPDSSAGPAGLSSRCTKSSALISRHRSQP